MMRPATMIRSACLRNFSQSLRSGDFCRYTSQAAASLQQVCEPSAYSDDESADHMDWDNLGFGLTPADYMYTMKCSNDYFEKGRLSRYGKIELSPSSGVLNYGQGLFEGMKAYRKEDGQLILFRPDQNATRLQTGAERMCMPSPSIDQFIDAVKQTALANKRWVPPPGKGSLYIRPLLVGSGPILGLAPAPEYTFLVFASPVGNYFKEGLAPLNLYVEDEFHRATPGGAGGVKAISNYAPVLKAISRAKNRGFSDVLYLDSVNKKNLEEVSSCNIFILKGNIISTPATSGTILAGITRKSIIEIASDYGFQVEERTIPVDELLEADEVFCTGTAVVVAPVGSITYRGKRIEFKTGAQSVCRELYSTLVGIQTGLIKDNKGWTFEIN
ncbi:branched-chain-amino-acid aminotransferase 2, chloroplastic isoform X2 [Citrus sinensis]|uniref:branched-chain-amino-acid aminotransferase 2, chloroplastic isoform X2 n=1 Tax=Citrus clementina TaxID=85681 RepID=UPI000CED61AE|nr:branched-chain-amino-acid aminotransferase 2, chloroplastic isoform X2 [Citrus x clementina]XP_052298573.1 branched-chain-amino-acid aminotransferase 2, chloroplastic isoform X2 [Citrus sinensis]